MTSEADSEDSRPKKLQKKRKGKKDDGAADAKNDPTGPSAAEKYAKELLDSRRPTKRRRRRNRTLVFPSACSASSVSTCNSAKPKQRALVATLTCETKTRVTHSTSC